VLFEDTIDTKKGLSILFQNMSDGLAFCQTVFNENNDCIIIFLHNLFTDSSRVALFSELPGGL